MKIATVGRSRRRVRGPLRVLVVLAGALALGCREADRTIAPDADPGPAVAGPHIVVLIADDLGWADVGYHGSRIRTPHIDRLAREGLELDRFYAAPLCSPTRAALLTGRHPIRYGLGGAVIAPWHDFGLDPQELTLPQALARAGYRHRAAFGKWHLGHLRRRWHPLERGFTHFRGHYNGAVDYFTHERDGERDWQLDHEPLDQPGYTTDLIAEAASRYILEHAGDGPLLCYVAFNAPHAPFMAPDDVLATYAHLAEPDGSPGLRQVLAAMVTSMDAGIGRILDALEQAGIADDTLVWFLSDNGGTGALLANNQPLRGNKHDVYEGGVRVPSCIRWPARLVGGRRIETPVAAIDVLPTLLQAAGLAQHGGKPLDGTGLLDVLGGSAPPPQRELYFFFGQAGPERERLAVSAPPWKLVLLGPDVRSGPVDSRHSRQLFDLRADPGEVHDLAVEHPAVVEELTRKLVAYRRLQPAQGVPPHEQGREGFVPPPRWRITTSW